MSIATTPQTQPVLGAGGGEQNPRTPNPESNNQLAMATWIRVNWRLSHAAAAVESIQASPEDLQSLDVLFFALSPAVDGPKSKTVSFFMQTIRGCPASAPFLSLLQR